MVIMRSEERRAYTVGLYPYLRTSLAIFVAGFIIGLIIVARFPPLTDYFQDTIATFVKLFAGIPRVKLAGAIFLTMPQRHCWRSCSESYSESFQSYFC